MKLKTQLTQLSMAVALVFGMAATPVIADDHHHDHGEAHSELQLNNGEKWNIDAPLKLAMSKIRAAVHAELDGIHANNLPQANYQALADEVNTQIAYMIENCELEPAADAQLHIVLHALMDGAKAMQSKDEARAGAVKVVGAIKDYTTYFNDPSLKPLQH